MRIRRSFITAGGVALASGALALGQAGPGVAQSPSDEGVTGNFSLLLMVHTSASTPNFATPATNPWNGVRQSGVRYTYRSIPCTGAAPVNNISSDLPTYGARVRGSRAPSSLRAHPFGFRLRRVRGVWQMRGRVVLTVCKLSGGPTAAPDPIPDAEKPKIFVRFRAEFKKLSVENLNYSGTFEIEGGTGRYRGLRGAGSIAGYFFCFNPEGCASTGRKYRDGQMVMHGTYRDRTPQLDG